MASHWVFLGVALIILAVADAKSSFLISKKRLEVIEKTVRLAQTKNFKEFRNRAGKLIKPYSNPFKNDIAPNCTQDYKNPFNVSDSEARAQLSDFDATMSDIHGFLSNIPIVGDIIKSDTLTDITKTVVGSLCPEAGMITNPILGLLTEGKDKLNTVKTNIKEQRKYEETIKKYDAIICQNGVSQQLQEEAKKQREQMLNVLNQVGSKITENTNVIKQESEKIASALNQASADILASVKTAADQITGAISGLAKIIVTETDRKAFLDTAKLFGELQVTYKEAWKTLLQPETDIMDSWNIDKYVEACHEHAPLSSYGQITVLLQFTLNTIRANKILYTDAQFGETIKPFNNILDQFELTFPLCEWLEEAKANNGTPKPQRIADMREFCFTKSHEFASLINDTNAARHKAIMSNEHFTSLVFHDDQGLYNDLKTNYSQLLYKSEKNIAEVQAFFVAADAKIISHSFEPERVAAPIIPAVKDQRKIILSYDETVNKPSCNAEINNTINNDSKMTFCGFLTLKEKDQKPNQEVNGIVQNFVKNHCNSSNYLLLHYLASDKVFAATLSGHDFHVECKVTDRNQVFAGKLFLF